MQMGVWSVVSVKHNQTKEIKHERQVTHSRQSWGQYLN